MSLIRRLCRRVRFLHAPGAREDGSALIEFVGASVILLVPLLYLLLSVFQVQRGAFAASEAAREAGRAFATAPSSSVGIDRATYAAQLAFGDQGISAPPDVRFVAAGAGCGAGSGDVSPTLTPGASYTVCVQQEVTLPYADQGFLAHAAHSRIRVTGKFALSIDQFRSAA
jgi:hypothetical protein